MNDSILYFNSMFFDQANMLSRGLCYRYGAIVFSYDRVNDIQRGGIIML